MNTIKQTHRVQQNPSTPKANSPEPEGAFRDLLPELQQAIRSEGYTTPTPIQQESIPPLLEGRDLTGCAQTGTGKTAAFVLPMLQRLSACQGRPNRNRPRALILAPTRELAAQIGDSIGTYGKFLSISHTVVFGGVHQSRQVKAMNRGVDILVATPGRLLDLMEQGHIRLDEVSVFVLDEVDRMLDMGFIPDIKRVLTEVPANRQTLFFSATMNRKIADLAATMVTDPVTVRIAPEEPTVDRINQRVLFVNKKNKDRLLMSIVGDPAMRKVIIFTQMKHAANKVADKLRDAGIRGTAIHGNKSQAARTKALDGFKNNRFKVLVATDVAARGLDVDDVTHVINYDLPIEAETYIHRIGRTGRAGAGGDAISFCTAEDRAYLRHIERLLGEPVEPDRDHDCHCDQAEHSKAAAPKNFGRGGGRGGQRGGPSKGPNGRHRNRSKSSSRPRRASKRTARY